MTPTEALNTSQYRQFLSNTDKTVIYPHKVAFNLPIRPLKPTMNPAPHKGDGAATRANEPQLSTIYLHTDIHQISLSNVFINRLR